MFNKILMFIIIMGTVPNTLYVSTESSKETVPKDYYKAAFTAFNWLINNDPETMVYMTLVASMIPEGDVEESYTKYIAKDKKPIWIVKIRRRSNRFVIIQLYTKKISEGLFLVAAKAYNGRTLRIVNVDLKNGDITIVR